MEHQFKPFDKIIVRDSKEDTWKCEFFSFYEKNSAYHYVGVGDSYEYCLPYEGNEHLVGTTNSPTPPEPEFKFGDKVEVLLFDTWVRGIFLCKINNTCPYRVVTIEEVEEDKKERNNIKHYFKHCRHADW